MGHVIAVDARMIGHSGIGTVIANLLPHLRILRPDWHFILLGDPSQLAKAKGIAGENVSFFAYTPPIYSLAEQTHWPDAALNDFALTKTGRPVSVTWVPHYNISMRCSGPLLVTVHDVAHLALPELFGWHKRLYARILLGFVARRATEVVFVSQFTADEFSRLVGPIRQSSCVIHSGVDASWFEPVAGPSPVSAPYILYVGNIKPHKNLGRLLQAFSQLSPDIAHRLVLVGKKEGFMTGDKAMTQFMQQNSERIDFTGYVDDATLRRYVAHADGFVFPSYYEGWGLPPTEAMAAGCPVAVSRAASLPEACGSAALYFDPQKAEDIATALRQLLHDDGLRADLRQRGRQRAESLRWETSARSYLAALERVADGKDKAKI